MLREPLRASAAISRTSKGALNASKQSILLHPTDILHYQTQASYTPKKTLRKLGICPLLVVMVVILDDDEVFLGNDQLFAVDLVKNFRLEHLGRRPGGEESRFEQDQSIHP